MVNIVQQNCQEKKLQDSCENPLSGGERRLQPSGVGPARLEQPTPTPLPRRGIKFIPRGAHFHALWCRPRRHGSAEEFCKVRVVRFIQVAMTKMGAEGKSPPPIQLTRSVHSTGRFSMVSVRPWRTSLPSFEIKSLQIRQLQGAGIGRSAVILPGLFG